MNIAESEKFRFSRLGENKTLIVVLLFMVLTLIPNMINMFTANKSQAAIISGMNKTNNLLEILITQQRNLVDADAMKVIYRATLDQSRLSLIEACMYIISQDQLASETRRDFVRVKIRALMTSLYKSDINELSLFYFKGRPLSVGLATIDIDSQINLVCEYLFLRYDSPDFRENLVGLVKQEFDTMYEEIVGEMMMGINVKQ